MPYSSLYDWRGGIDIRLNDPNGSDDATLRRYNRWHARFDQPDPYDGSYDLSDPQSLNRYSYVQNDPVNFTDPTGLDDLCYPDPVSGQIVCIPGYEEDGGTVYGSPDDPDTGGLTGMMGSGTEHITVELGPEPFEHGGGQRGECHTFECLESRARQEQSRRENEQRIKDCLDKAWNDYKAAFNKHFGGASGLASRAFDTTFVKIGWDGVLGIVASLTTRTVINRMWGTKMTARGNLQGLSSVLTGVSLYRTAKLSSEVVELYNNYTRQAQNCLPR